MSPASYIQAYSIIINLIVLTAFIFAFLAADNPVRFALTLILAVLLLLPYLVHGQVVTWLIFAGKVLFGLACLVYTKARGLF